MEYRTDLFLTFQFFPCVPSSAWERVAIFPGGSEGNGLTGLRDYLREQRQNEFIENLSRKLLSYALGRTLLLSDKQTMETMKQKLAADEFRFEKLVETIVTSRQFLNNRGQEKESGQ